ncbi:L-lactate permease [Desulfofundulus australicus DSM 11792]|uniref:L-lactate permease n=1 Tax=Desulfofundulus australicus DSM 11792 TaxID=1121425 RepID=A0A1M4ULP4_9FIRM|nr:L-lactate permease [Desulfofundulus australicus DSM 11792]
MTWTQAINPLGNLGLSALVDALPIIFLFCALALWRMKGHIAGLITLALALVLAVGVHGMPLNMALLTTVYGILSPWCCCSGYGNRNRSGVLPMSLRLL